MGFQCKLEHKRKVTNHVNHAIQSWLHIMWCVPIAISLIQMPRYLRFHKFLILHNNQKHFGNHEECNTLQIMHYIFKSHCLKSIALFFFIFLERYLTFHNYVPMTICWNKCSNKSFTIFKFVLLDDSRKFGSFFDLLKGIIIWIV
jgi:hypothetical protein